MNQLVAREQAADRLRRARARELASQTWHPPSRVRWRAASVVARLAWRLDAEAARIALK
ncbi:MAG: hypothetical protein WKF94_15705 [Solirubrobacteraceae bacterium]